MAENKVSHCKGLNTVVALLVLLASMLLVACGGAPSQDAQASIGVVDMAYVQQHLEAARMVDARAPELFAGEESEDGSDNRTGHIPGAISFSRTKLFDKNGEPIADVRLQRIFDRQEIDYQDELIVYGDAASADDVTKVAELLAQQGFAHVSIYEAGFDEWVQHGENEVEQAKSCCAA